MRFSIIRTKLNRPRLRRDLVCRERLHRLLDHGREGSLTLVSAPAGYGKSTAVAQWLVQQSGISVWVSLNRADSDLQQFLLYLLTGFREVLPNSCAETWSLITGAELPPASEIAGTLVNEIVALDNPMTVVLDDYYLLGDSPVNEFIEQLLAYAPPSFHLIIITRRDPPLPLALLRADGRIAEIRQRVLQFDDEEIAAFFHKILNRTTTPIELKRIQQSIEGWAVGLRLIGLAIDGLKEDEPIPLELAGENLHIHEYLITEVLEKQPPKTRRLLLCTAILDRFCAPLCDALDADDDDGKVAFPTRGERFIAHLEETGMLCVALDDEHKWYRYHHLFQQVLERQMTKQLSGAEIEQLHFKAAEWLDAEGLLEEAVTHSLRGGDRTLPARIVSHRRHDLMNQEEWDLIGRLIRALPRSQVESDAALSMLETWFLWNRMQVPELVGTLDRTDTLLAHADPSDKEADALLGEVSALRSFQYYMAAPPNGTRALEHAEVAIEKIPSEHHSARGFAVIMHAMSHHMVGDTKTAYEVVHAAMGDSQAYRNTYHTRLLVTIGFMSWMDGDINLLYQTATEYRALGEALNLAESRAIALHFMGLVHYFRGEHEEAARSLEPIVLKNDTSNIFNYANSNILLALTYQSQGKEDEARQLVETALRYAVGSNSPSNLSSII